MRKKTNKKTPTMCLLRVKLCLPNPYSTYADVVTAQTCERKLIWKQSLQMIRMRSFGWILIR